MERTPKKTSAVETTEQRLLQLFLDKQFKLGDALPQELALCEELGVARSVLREALSRFRMMGLIQTRTRRGMILSEPDILSGMGHIFHPNFFTLETLMQMLELRMACEIGAFTSMCDRINTEDIDRLRALADNNRILDDHTYSISDEVAFHLKMYEMSGNPLLQRFQNILYIVLTYVNQAWHDELRTENERLMRARLFVSHADLLECLASRDKTTAFTAIDRHFAPYRAVIERKRRALSETHK